MTSIPNFYEWLFGKREGERDRDWQIERQRDKEIEKEGEREWRVKSCQAICTKRKDDDINVVWTHNCGLLWANHR